MNNSENSDSIKKDNENDEIKNDSLNFETNNPNPQNTTDLENYNFGWSNYSEITNGRFAMIGFAAIILIELISNKSFINWAGFLN